MDTTTDRSDEGRQGSDDSTADARPWRVLIADDEIHISRLLAELISLELHATCCEVRSAEEAIAQLEQHPFDLVVSDIRMPGIGGVGLLQWVRKNCPQLKRRFIFVTACAGAIDSEHMIDQVGVPVVRKPFACRELVDVLRLLLEDRHLEPRGERMKI